MGQSKILIANNMHDYIYGNESGFHCDGLIFTYVQDADVVMLEHLAKTYGKDIKVLRNYYDQDVKTEVTNNAFSEESDLEAENRPGSAASTSERDTPAPVFDKRKIKKVFVHNSEHTIKILPSELPEYLSKGYKAGRKG